jgi:hypothetical protein
MSSLQRAVEFVFIMDDVPDLSGMLQHMPPGKEVHVLSSTGDGLAQMADLLAGFQDVSSIHLVSHGSAGALQLGDTLLTADSIGKHAADLARVRSSLAEGADLLLYGCEAGAGEAGAALMNALAQATGADVAASTNVTGAAALGGDWTLEAHRGEVQASALGAKGELGAVKGLLATGTTFDFGNAAMPHTGSATATTTSGGYTLTATVNNGDAVTIDTENYYLAFDQNGLDGNVLFVDAFDAYSNFGDNLTSITFSLGGYTFDVTSMNILELAFGDTNFSLTFTNNSGGATQASVSNPDLHTASLLSLNAAQLKGITSFTITRTDGTNPYLAFDNITLSNINAAPTFAGGTTTLSLAQNAAATSVSSLLQVNDADGGQTLTWTQSSGPSHGTLSIYGATASSGGMAITPGGTITYAPAAGFAGIDTFTVQVSDGLTTATRTITVNVTPSAPGTPTLATGSDSGDSSSDRITNSSTLQFSGTGASGDNSSTVLVFVDKNGNGSYDSGTDASGTATMSGGSWTVSGVSTAGLTDGAYNVYARATSSTGSLNSALSGAQSITIDKTAPVTTIATAAFSADSGSSASDFVTSAAAQTISGTLSANLASGEHVEVSADNGATWSTATASVGNNTWSHTTTLVSSNTLKIRVVDAAGNAGTTLSQAYVLDTTAPGSPSTPDLSSGSDTGSSSTDNITNDDTPTITGTAESGSSVTLYDTDGTTVLGTATATGGNWSITASTLGAGGHTVTAVATDAAGNTSGASSSLAITVDTSAPSGLALSTTSVATSNAGSSATLATLSASDGQAITYSLGVGNGTNDADNGSFAIAGNSLKVGGSALSAGTYKVYLTATDAAGNAGSQAFTITVVDAPSVSSIVRAGGVSSAVQASASSVSYTVTFSESVTGVDASDFSLAASGTASGSITAVSGSGSTYTVTVDSLAGDGTLRLDLKGSGTGIANGSSTAIAGGYSAGQTFTLDHTAPTITFSGIAFSADSGSSATDFITSTVAQTISATLSATLAGGDVLYGSLDGGATWSDITASVSGTALSWSATLAASGTLKLKVADVAGNDGSATSQAYVLDTVAPAAPSAPDLDAGSDSGSSASDNVTNDTTPTFSGTAESGSLVTLYDSDGTTVLGSATAAGGSWSIASSALGEGNHTVTVKATDTAGNVSSASSGLTVNIDTTAPTTSFSGIAFSADTGSSSSDLVTATAAQTISATLSATLAAGELAFGSLDGGATWTDITSRVSGTALAWSTTLAASNNLKLKVTDAAGNGGAASSQAYVLDTAAPAAPSAPDLAVGSDSGSSSSDDITSDTTPTFTGTAESSSTVTLYDTDGSTVLGTATATGGNWSITASALASGTHTVTAKATDSAGNVSSASSGATIAVDAGAPAVASIVRAGSANTNGATVSYTVTFNESVTGVDLADFVLTAGGTASGTLSSISGSGSSYTVDVSGASGDGTLRLDLKGSGTGIADLAANAISTGFTSGEAYTLDHVAPTLAITSSTASLQEGESATVTFTFSEDPGSSFTAADVVVTGGTLGALSGSGTVRTASFTATAVGNASLNVAAASYTDAAGNAGSGASGPALTVTAAPQNGNLVDGVPVTSSTATDPQTGLSETTTVVAPIAPSRVDDPNTPNATLADIPLGIGSGPTATGLTVGLAVGTGLQAEGPAALLTNSQALLDLIQRIEDRTVDGSASQIDMTGDGEDFLGALGGQVRLQTGTLALQGGGAGVQVAVNGSAPGSTPAQGTAIGLVLDGSALQAGTTVQLNNVDFAAVVGGVTLRGGAGANYVVGDNASQNIFLGAEDDILNGGGGDDFIGSRGGNDILDGGEGKDLVAGGEGNDRLQGGGGDDVLVGGRSTTGDWKLYINDKGVLSASHTRAALASAATETVAGTELDSHASALGFLHADSARVVDVALLYSALGRLPDLGGLAFWSQAPVSVTTVAGHLLQSDERLASQGQQDNTAFLQSVYQQVLGRAADAAGLEFWGKALAAGVARANVLADFALGAEHRGLAATADGIAVAQAAGLAETGWMAASGNDRLEGGAGNDTLVGGDGSDVLVGGAGRDTAQFSARLGDYRLLLGADGQLRVQAAGASDVDVLSEVEVAAFGDQSLELDFMAAPVANLKEVGMLYASLLGRAADVAGLRWWLSTGLEGKGLASAFAVSKEGAALAAGKSDAEFVRMLYSNAGIAGDAAGGEAYWTAYLGSHSRGEMLADWAANEAVQKAEFGTDGLWLV